MELVDYDWVYMFHSMMSERFGFSDSRRVLALPVADLPFFLDRAFCNNLSDRLFVDYEGTILSSLKGVERGEKMVFRGSDESISVVPDSLFYVVEPDPRFSYVALFSKSPQKSCVLFYPQGSALMSDKHKLAVLEDLLVDSELVDFVVPFEVFEHNWLQLDNPVDAIAERVGYILANLGLRYGSLKGRFEVDENAPASQGKSFVVTRYVTANIETYHSKHCKHADLMCRLSEDFSYFSPFNSVIYDLRVGRNKSNFSVLFCVPEALKRNL